MKLITDKLKERKKLYDIPGLPYLPKGDVVLVYRLPNMEKTPGGLWLADVDQTERHVGVLLACGLKAMDELQDALIEIGDLVWFGLYAGDSHEADRKALEKGKKIVQVKVKEILGSEDALDRVYGTTATHAVWFDDENTEQHWYKPLKESRNGH